MDECIDEQPDLDALTMAYWRRKPEKGLLHHSDRGSQYACEKYQSVSKKLNQLPDAGSLV
jgi:transposase InsO family protein